MRFWETGGSTPSPGNPIIKVVGLDAAGNQYPLTLGPGLAITGNVLDVTGSGGGSSYSPEAQAYFARLTGTYTTQWKNSINARIVELVNGGVWALLDCLWATKIANNDADSRLNLISNVYSLTGGTFVNGSGIRTNGSQINTGYNPGANTLKYTQNNAHYGVYLHSNLTAGSAAEPATRIAGLFINAVNASLLYANSSGSGFATINTSGAGTYNTHAVVTQGFLQANRIASGSFTSNFNGTRLTGNHNSQALANTNYLISPAGWDGIFSAATIGSGLNNTQDELLRTTLDAMLA